MARHVRVDVEGGWYHVTARGTERRAIFVDERDHEHLELVRCVCGLCIGARLAVHGGPPEASGREHVQQHVRRGDSPEGYEECGARVALGSQAFLAKVKGWAGKVTKEQPARKQVLKQVTVAEVVSIVERKRGEAWAAFSNRHGDWGRELVMFLARRRSGLTWMQIGAELGIKEYKTVGKAVQRFAAAIPADHAKRKLVKECLHEMSLVET